MDQFSVSQGASLTIDVTLRDQAGAVVTTCTGSETLTTTLWPGDDRLASFAPATAWTVAAAGTLAITITAAQTALLEPGRYQLRTRLGDAGAVVDAYVAAVTITPAAGLVAAPPVYGSYNDLQTYGRSWLEQLQDESDQAGYAEQRARARSWIDDIAQAHYRTIGPGRSDWLQAQLDADALIVTDQVREVASLKALELICRGQVDAGDGGARYGRLARMYRSQADYLGSLLLLGIDTDGDGLADLTIDCSSTNPMYG